MPRRTLPRIAAVSAGAKPLTLEVEWAEGGRSFVDVSGMVDTFAAYAPLREDAALFAHAAVGEFGADVTWNEDVDMSADTLWRLAREQSGATMTAAAFRQWRERKAYTLETAARALGVSRRTVAYYDRGARPIPRTVALAVKALEMGLG
ncbi:MAG: helix-turn-helix domain-containing protein [Caulobacteraceae bacterium]